jgi:hypothetical protein
MPFAKAISWTSRGMSRKSTNIPLISAIHTSRFWSKRVGSDHSGSGRLMSRAGEMTRAFGRALSDLEPSAQLGRRHVGLS